MLTTVFTKGPLLWQRQEIVNSRYLACFSELMVSIYLQLVRNDISDELQVSPHTQFQKASE